jgi:hypothetical protein
MLWIKRLLHCISVAHDHYVVTCTSVSHHHYVVTCISVAHDHYLLTCTSVAHDHYVVTCTSVAHDQYVVTLTSQTQIPGSITEDDDLPISIASRTNCLPVTLRAAVSASRTVAVLCRVLRPYTLPNHCLSSVYNNPFLMSTYASINNIKIKWNGSHNVTVHIRGLELRILK